MSKQVKRNEKGQIVAGSGANNPKGRPKGISFMDDFRVAIQTVQRQKRVSLLEHFVSKAYEDKRVLIACIDRLLPALKAVQGVIACVDDMMDDETAEAIRQKLLTQWGTN